MSSSGFFYSGWPLSETKINWKDRQILGSCQRAEKTVEREGDSDTSSS